MTTFLVLYNGPATPPGASHEDWPEWFRSLGDKLADQGSPMVGGFAVRSDGSTGSATRLNGYSVIRAADRHEAQLLVSDHPFVRGGPEFALELFELPAK